MAMYQEARGVLTEPAAVGPLTEGVAGIAVIILCVLGLAAIATTSMAAISVIIIGAGLIMEAGNTAGECSRAGTAAGEIAQPGADMMVEFMAGGAGVILGVLALLGINAAHLVPAALIVFGAALLLAGASATRIGSVGMEAGLAQTVTWRSDLSPSRGVQMLVGIGAVVLGILALVIAANTAVLVLVGMLAVGAALLATSANFTRAVASTLVH